MQGSGGGGCPDSFWGVRACLTAPLPSFSSSVAKHKNGNLCAKLKRFAFPYTGERNTAVRYYY